GSGVGEGEGDGSGASFCPFSRGMQASGSSAAACDGSTSLSAVSQSVVSGSCGGGRFGRGCPLTRGGGGGSGRLIHIGSPLFQLGTWPQTWSTSFRRVSTLERGGT